MNDKQPTGFLDDDARPFWAGVISLSLGVFGLVTAEFLPASLLTPMSHDLGVSIGAAGQSVTMTAVVGAIAGPAVVVATSRFDRRYTLLGLTALLILSSALAALSSGMSMLLLSRALLGIGLGGFWAMSLALAMRLVPERLMPRAMAIIMGGVSAATVCAAPVGAWVGELMGWRSAFVITGVLGVVALLAQALTLPAMPSTGSSNLGTMATVLRRPVIRIGLLTILLVVAGHFAGFTFIRPFLEDVPHFGVEGVSGTLLAFGIGGFFGNFFGGFVSERNTALSITLAAAGIAIAAFVLSFAGASPVIATVATTFWGFAFGALPVSVQSFVTQAASDEPESAGALTLTTFQVAISSGAVFGGLIVGPHGPAGVLAFAGLSALLGAALIGFAGRTRLADPAEA
ncbi:MULTISPECIES: MFS transporter [unclassified Rhizobium]|uniref:MFS transporter n=1 Tax=unclassified Rhizobium TaxID=2613769 RepID=UPI0007136278|nr:MULTISPECIES: MFS transporter [unclassified Rhizobium]KQS83592.1 transporter [Rhizobium sp. Leaf386]KQT03835.1 transporter [Rhizobium sp. Leaf391]KQU03685.1 transporter [Rhizobium sp. Leaf453]